jgi:cytochrome b pre-mRNA-processing protein 3
MISLPFRRSPQLSTIDALYGTIVAQARSPVFYRSYGVPDTLAARMDMIVLHLVLVLRRLHVAAKSTPVANLLSQGVFDRFCEDMDDNLREMGVGDLAVPKEMRRVGEAFYGRAKAYEPGLAANDADAIATAIARNVFGDTQNLAMPPLGAVQLAHYMQEAAARLGAQATELVLRAELVFPNPEAALYAAPPGGQG